VRSATSHVKSRLIGHASNEQFRTFNATSVEIEEARKSITSNAIFQLPM